MTEPQQQNRHQTGHTFIEAVHGNVYISADEHVPDIHINHVEGNIYLARGLSYTRLFLSDATNPENGFALDAITKIILPYLDSLFQIQHTLDTLAERLPSDLRILGIYQGSVTVDVTGGIRDTAELIRDEVTPWRRRVAKELAELAVKEKEIELKQKEIELNKAKATLKQDKAQAELERVQLEAAAAKTAAEAQKISAEAQLLQMQAAQQALSNQKIQLELATIMLNLLEQKAPNLGEEKRLLFAMQMMGPIQLIATSPLVLDAFAEVGSTQKEIG